MVTSNTYHCIEDDDGTAAANQDDVAASTALAADYSGDGMIIGLNAWIDAAIESLKTTTATASTGHNNQHNNNIVSSREYVSCALKIAHSLADQLCVVDEKRKVTTSAGLDGDGGGGGISLDPSIINEIMAGPHQRRWQQRKYESLAHSVYVRCGANVLTHGEKKDDGSRTTTLSTPTLTNNDLEPLPLHRDESFEPDDLGILAQQLSSLLEGGSDHIIEYLNVRCATLREDLVRDLCINDDARMVAIHSLGATFFQLFSGGQQVPEQVGTTVQSSVGMLGTKCADRLDHMSKKTQRSTQSSTVSSVESLKSLGLPTALCDLISNMIDRTNEGATGDESYEAVTDLRDDLRLMMDSPEVYLRDLDMTHASTVGLQMESIGDKDGRTYFYGRELELATLKESYQRSVSSGCEVAMIYGSSGIGKSMLSNKFAEDVTSRRDGHIHDGGSGVFLSGSFDKLQQSQPFHAISSAFDEYCTLLSTRDESTVEMVSTALKRDLGDEISSLVTAMPSLRVILGNDCVCDQNDGDSDVAVDAQK
eukprot:scaffold8454_cov74-Skeletonema_dohrnii-CCMP3373.AAC.1